MRTTYGERFMLLFFCVVCFGICFGVEAILIVLGFVAPSVYLAFRSEFHFWSSLPFWPCAVAFIVTLVEDHIPAETTWKQNDQDGNEKDEEFLALLQTLLAGIAINAVLLLAFLCFLVGFWQLNLTYFTSRLPGVSEADIRLVAEDIVVAEICAVGLAYLGLTTIKTMQKRLAKHRELLNAQTNSS